MKWLAVWFLLFAVTVLITIAVKSCEAFQSSNSFGQAVKCGLACLLIALLFLELNRVWNLPRGDRRG